MPQRTKVAPEEKIAAVEAYLQGKLSWTGALKRCGICDKTWRQWLILYETRGQEGLMRQAHNRKYEPVLKEQVVHEYLSGQNSVLGLCKKYSISDSHMVSNWIKRYNGKKGFERSNGGSEIYMTKGRATTLEERMEIVTYYIEHGKDYGAAIERYQVSYQQIYSWARKYKASGISGLADKRGKRKRPEEMTEI